MRNKQHGRNEIRLVIFDAYGVLFSRGYPDTAEAVAKKYGLDSKRIFDVLYTKYFNKAAVREISQKEAWDLSVRELGLPISGEELRDLHFSLVRLNNKARCFAEGLKKKHTILMLSKNTRSQFRWLLGAFPVLRKSFGKNILNTWEYGLPKAGKETVDFVCKRFRVLPSEILYIDDQENNLAVPREMGVRAILYKNFPQFQESFHKIIRQ